MMSAKNPMAPVIADAMVGAAYGFPAPTAFRTRIADLLQLYAGDPACVLMWAGEKILLSSRSEQDLAAYSRMPNMSAACVSSFKVPASDLRIALLMLPSGDPRADLVGELALHLRSAERPARKLIADLLSQPDDVTPTRRSEPQVAGDGLTSSEVEAMLRPFRVRYDLALEALHVHDNPLLTGRHDGRVNLFTVVRYVTSVPHVRVVVDAKGRTYTYGYSEQILFPRNARSTLEQVLRDDVRWRGVTVQDALREIERPLDIGERFIADTAFESGCLLLADLKERLGVEGHVQKDLPGKDTIRHELESACYGSIQPASARALFIPVHVGGTPWLCLYTLVDSENPQERWRLYRLYREVLPQIADRVRASAKEAFLDCVANEFRGHVASGMTVAGLRGLNASLFKISMVYPFPVVRLELAISGESASENVIEIGTDAVRVSLDESSRPLPQQLRHEGLQVSAVVTRLAEEYNAITGRARLTRDSALADVLHGTSTAVKAIGIEEIVQSLSRFGRAPLRSLGDLRYRLIDLKGHRDDAAAEALIGQLNAAEAAFESSKALLTFGDLCLQGDQPVRRKFQARSRTKLAALVVTAAALAEAASGERPRRRLTVNVDEAGPDTRPGHWVVPVGYLDESIIRGLLIELFNNAILYGAPSSEGMVTVDCAIEADGDATRCELSNAMPLDKSVRPLGFLERTAIALKQLPYLRLAFASSAKVFRATLAIGPLWSLPEGKTEPERKALEWSSDPEEETKW